MSGKMKTSLAVCFLLMMAAPISGFGLVSSMMSNPSTMLSAARYMTQILMRNMAQKHTGSVLCIAHVERSAVTFFNEAAASLQLGRLLQMTMRRSAVVTSGSAAVPLDKFCQLVRVRRLRAASDAFVSRLGCLGDGAVDDTDRLFRALVYTIEHVCRDGGTSTTQFMADARQCSRWLDAGYDEQIERVKSWRGGRRDAPSTAAGTTSVTATTGHPPSTIPPTTPSIYPSLQACFDDVNGLLPPGAQLRPRELTNVLLTLPRLLQHDGLAQFCPALLKAGDCAHLALADCSRRTQQTIARFFQTTLRGILCDNIPEDDVLARLIWSGEVKERYFGL